MFILVQSMQKNNAGVIFPIPRCCRNQFRAVWHGSPILLADFISKLSHAHKKWSILCIISHRAIGNTLELSSD